MTTPPIMPSNPPGSQGPDQNNRLDDKNKNKVPPFDKKRKSEAGEDEGKRPSLMELAASAKKKQEEKQQEEELAANVSQSSIQFAHMAQQGAESVQQVEQTQKVNTDLVEVAHQVSQYIHSMNITSINQESVVTVTIQSAGMFNHANVQVNTVGGEHNLIFTNLTQQAQLVLENRVNQSHLREALDQRGITVHNIRTERAEQATTTPKSEQTREDQQERGRDREGGGGGQQRQRGR